MRRRSRSHGAKGLNVAPRPSARHGSPSEDRTKASLEETLVEVWRKALVENAREVQIGEQRYPVQRTTRKHLRQVVFVFDGKEIRAIEQNPETKSRWAQMARVGKKVMQFISGGSYLANVVDGEVMLYGKSTDKHRGQRA